MPPLVRPSRVHCGWNRKESIRIDKNRKESNGLEWTRKGPIGIGRPRVPVRSALHNSTTAAGKPSEEFRNGSGEAVGSTPRVTSSGSAASCASEAIRSHETQSEATRSTRLVELLEAVEDGGAECGPAGRRQVGGLGGSKQRAHRIHLREWPATPGGKATEGRGRPAGRSAEAVEGRGRRRAQLRRGRAARVGAQHARRRILSTDDKGDVGVRDRWQVDLRTQRCVAEEQ